VSSYDLRSVARRLYSTLSEIAQLEVQDHVARHRFVTDPCRSEAPLLGCVDRQVREAIFIGEQLYARDLPGSLDSHLDADRTFSSECGAHIRWHRRRHRMQRLGGDE